MHIYAIQNKINRKIYFGQTVQDLDYYWSYNIKCALKGKSYKPALYSAIRKYGPENFDFIDIGTAQTKEQLDNWEKLSILVYGTKKKELGYNLTDGGDGTIGAERTDTWKDNISKGNTGKKWDENRKKEASLQRKGRVLSAEHRLNIGAGVKGTKKPDKWVKKLIERNKARKGEKRKPRKPEHQAKLGASRRKNNSDRKISEVQNGINTV